MKEIIIETVSHLKVTKQGIELKISIKDIKKAREEYLNLTHQCDLKPDPRITTTEQICLGCGETDSFANYNGSSTTNENIDLSIDLY